MRIKDLNENQLRALINETTRQIDSTNRLFAKGTIPEVGQKNRIIKKLKSHKGVFSGILAIKETETIRQTNIIKEFLRDEEE